MKQLEVSNEQNLPTQALHARLAEELEDRTEFVKWSCSGSGSEGSSGGGATVGCTGTF